MRFLQVFVVIFLMWKVDLKAVNTKNDMIFQQDSPLDSSVSKQYIPLIDGRPIFIPEEFAEPSESLDLKNDHGLDKIAAKFGQNGDMPALEIDEVFPADERKNIKQKPSNLKYPQNLLEYKIDSHQETDKEYIKKPEPTKRAKICKVKKIKKVSGTNNKHFTNAKEENVVKKKADLNKNVGTPTSESIGRNVIEHTNDDFFESGEHHSLQEDVKSMFGPSFKSFVFNPLAPTKSKFQECNTSKNESGVCRYVQHCFLPSIVSSIQQFMNNMCIIENRFIGVCCPDFPVQAVLVNWKDSQQTFDDQETSDDETKTPQECGVGTNTRIVGGSDANVKAWPWMVALLNNKKDFFCGGALINNRYVLTAAHCTFGAKNDEIIARVGGYDLRNDQGEDYRVVEIKRHGQYNRFTLRNDVALLKLEKPVTFNEFVKTVCFPEETKNYTGKIATLAGWGRLQGGVSPFTSDILQEVDFPIVTNEECAAIHGLPIPDSLICTSAPSKDKSACNGDSGGPLMMLDDENRWKVVGVVSWGRRGCNTKFPSVFTRVTHYLDWIKHYAI